VSSLPLCAPGALADAGGAVLRRGFSRAAFGGPGERESHLRHVPYPPPAHGTPSQVGGASPVVVIAVESVPVVQGDLDLRSSFGSLPPILHPLVAVRPGSDPYAPEEQPLRGALVDRYV
jgi:hypothetical protein